MEMRVHIWIAATSKAFPIFSHSSATIHHTEHSVKNKNNNREKPGNEAILMHIKLHRY